LFNKQATLACDRSRSKTDPHAFLVAGYKQVKLACDCSRSGIGSHAFLLAGYKFEASH